VNIDKAHLLVSRYTLISFFFTLSSKTYI